MKFSPHSRTVLAVLVLLTLLAIVAIRYWRGPLLAAYPVEMRPLVQTVVATGRVVSVSRAHVGSQISGVVIERRVREGDRVAPGDVLAVLRADELEANVLEAEAALSQLEQSTRPQAQAAARDADAKLAQAHRESERRRSLLDRGLIAREALEQALQAETSARTAAERARLAANALAVGAPDEAVARERLAAARAALDKTLIRSQVAGTVLTRNAEPGDVVQPGKVLFDIAREGGTEVLVPLDEKNLGMVALGQPAQCVADAYPQQPFAAMLSFIAPSVDPQRGALDVRLTVDPVPDFLRQDMTVSVNIETARRDNTLVVPNDALIVGLGNRATLWRVSDGKVSRTNVTLGLRGLVASEVVNGLTAGDWVLADGGAEMADGQRVRVKQEAVAAPNNGAARNELPIKFN